MDVPKVLHFIYIGKAIRENYVENIRQNLNQYFISKTKIQFTASLNVSPIGPTQSPQFKIQTIKLIRI